MSLSNPSLDNPDRGIESYKAIFAHNLTSEIVQNKDRDRLCLAVAVAMLDMGVLDSPITIPSKKVSRGVLALDLIDFVREHDKGGCFLPETRAFLWEILAEGWLRSNNLKECLSFVRELAHTRFENPELGKVFEKSLRKMVQDKHVNNYAYHAFFNEAPRTECEQYPAIRIVGQEFVRDHPNNFIGKFTVGGG